MWTWTICTISINEPSSRIIYEWIALLLVDHQQTTSNLHPHHTRLNIRSSLSLHITHIHIATFKSSPDTFSRCSSRSLSPPCWPSLPLLQMDVSTAKTTPGLRRIALPQRLARLSILRTTRRFQPTTRRRRRRRYTSRIPLQSILTSKLSSIIPLQATFSLYLSPAPCRICATHNKTSADLSFIIPLRTLTKTSHLPTTSIGTTTLTYETEIPTKTPIVKTLTTTYLTTYWKDSKVRTTLTSEQPCTFVSNVPQLYTTVEKGSPKAIVTKKLETYVVTKKIPTVTKSPGTVTSTVCSAKEVCPTMIMTTGTTATATTTRGPQAPGYY